ncbi:hypothetical protein [Roseomonas sp. BN140053]|uniref:hypothetical protein n=1 Tax=Roseomonas sp. BN140053 TaxID=3391898 RepID=UPI0039EB031A
MAADFLDDRKAGLENAFFAEQDARLLQRLREADETKARKEALSVASGIKDDAVLEKLLTLNITSVTLTALTLVPLVLVAWADGSIDAKERSAVLAGAEHSGLSKEDASYQLFEGWLARKPAPELTATWKEYIRALSATLTDDARQALKSGILSRARGVAEAAGGFMGIGQKISAAEAAVLDDLERQFLKQ